MRCLVNSYNNWNDDANPPSSETELKHSMMVTRFNTFVIAFSSLFMAHLVIIAISFEARPRLLLFVLILYLAWSNNIYDIIATWLCYISSDIESIILKTQLK